MKLSIKDFFSKCDQIRSFQRVWSHLLKKSLMENFIFVQYNKFNESMISGFTPPETKLFMKNKVIMIHIIMQSVLRKSTEISL